MDRPKDIMAFLLAPVQPGPLPLRLHSLGRHVQTHIYRPEGFPHDQLLWCTEGSGSFEFPEGGSFTLSEGSALYLPGGVPHEYSPRGGGTWLLSFLSFDGPAAEAIALGCGFPPCVPFRLSGSMAGMERGLEDLWRDIHRGGQAVEQSLSARLYGLLLEAGEAAAAEQIQESRGKASAEGHLPPTPAELALRQALRLMEQHFTEQLDMSNLARAVGYSVQHFQRIFKQACGVPPYVYLQRLRLNRSLEWLMEQPALSVGEVAARLGWEANYFIRVFREHYGMSPGQYRRSHGQPKSPSQRPGET